jgi:hypothetical protein
VALGVVGDVDHVALRQPTGEVVGGDELVMPPCVADEDAHTLRIAMTRRTIKMAKTSADSRVKG